MRRGTSKQDLERHEPVEKQVAHQPHGAHASRAQMPHGLETGGQPGG